VFENSFAMALVHRRLQKLGLRGTLQDWPSEQRESKIGS